MSKVNNIYVHAILIVLKNSSFLPLDKEQEEHLVLLLFYYLTLY